MQEIVSKTVVALYPGGQLLQDNYFKQIRERTFNQDSYRTKEDGTFKDKKTILSPTGFGPNDRLHNPGAGSGLGREAPEQRAKGVGSGYNDGEPADDETGPGNSPTPGDPYAPQLLLNDMFMGLHLNKGTRDSIRQNMKKMVDGPGVTIPHRRYTVD